MTFAVIIDDEPVNIELLSAYLDKYNIEHIGSLSGRKGFTLVKQRQPDFVVLDLLMPGHSWDGYKTINELRSDEETKHIPIICVSAAGDKDIALRMGCDAFLRRPFSPDSLIRVIRQFIPAS